jgi:hypothetical protein
MAPQFLERGAAIVERAGVARFDDERAVVAGERLGMTSEFAEHEAAIGEHGDITWLNCERSADQFFRFPVAALLVPHHAEEMQGVEVPRIRGENLEVKRLGLGEHGAAMRRDGALQYRRHGIRRRRLRFCFRCHARARPRSSAAPFRPAGAATSWCRRPRYAGA